MMQDVHWSAGLFGYFPTYPLGNVYAGEIHAALRRDLPDLDAQLARGSLADVIDWLHERVYRHGRLYPPAELIDRACGRPPTAAPLLDYLEGKYEALASGPVS
jgi:carboxypeptidase Taq